MSRYDLIGYCSYRDNETGFVADDFVNVLNQQDDKIKELEKENNLLRQTLNNLKGEKASDTLVNAVNAVYEPLLQNKFDEIKELKQELKQKFEDMPMTDFIRLAKKNGYEVQANEDNSNQLAIEELEKVKNEHCCDYEHLKKRKILNIHGTYMLEFEENLIYYIDNRIKELRGEK